MPLTADLPQKALHGMLKRPAEGVRNQSTQQLIVITDPTGVNGDPTRNHATVVIGPLSGNTTLNGFGVAVYTEGKWERISSAGGGGKEYTTGAGLEGGGATAEIKVKAGGITLAMLESGLSGPSAASYGLRKLGTGGTEAAAGNDSRLSNERVPTAASVTEEKIALALLGPEPTVFGLRKLGTGSKEALPGNEGLRKSQNLSDLENTGTSRFNLKIPALTPAFVVTTSNETLSGLKTVDGVTLEAKQLVLVTGQTTKSENGFWEAESSAWVRPADFPHNGIIKGGRFTVVMKGTTNKLTIWELQYTAEITIDTTAQTWEKVPTGGSVTEKAIEEAGGVVLTGEQTITGRKRIEAPLLIGAPPQAAEVGSGTGAVGLQVLSLTAGKGGNTSGTGSVIGGIGAANLLKSGVGGSATGATTTGTGGAGGANNVEGGAGGSQAIGGTVKNTGGKGGALNLRAGSGGAAEGATSGKQKGGAGAGGELVGGGGGAAKVGTGENEAGVGGGFSVKGGPGGIAEGGSVNKYGNGGNASLIGGAAEGNATGGTARVEGGATKGASATGGNVEINGGEGNEGGTQGVVIFKTNGEERVKITATGNVEIKGTTGGLSMFGAAAYTSQHAAIPNPTLLTECASAIKEINEVLKKIGATA